MAGEVVLRVSGLTKRFPGVTALENVSFDLRAGEVHALCGENGAGKSTLIKVLAGIHSAGSYDGNLEVGGQPARFRSATDSQRAGIGVIHQELALVPGMTVAENVWLGRAPTRGGLLDWNALFAQTRQLQQRYHLDLDPAAPVASLGVGQQQLTEILKALAREPRVLLLDEPTAALSEREAAQLQEIVRGLRSKGIACIYISHRLDEVFALADRITVLRDGKSVATFDAAGTTRETLIRHMVGREIRDLFPRRASTPGEVLLKISNLSVADEDGDVRLENISLDVRAGEVVGLGGLMGAGRSELLLHLFGSYGRRRAGTVELCGQPYDTPSPAESLRRGLALVSEDRKRLGLVLGENIGFNLSLSSLQAVAPGGLIRSQREYPRNQRIFGELGIKARGQETVVGTLSGGNQQKVVLGKTLLCDPRVVLLDEPTRGIDVGAKVEVYELINRLTAEGRAVLMASSELPELLGLSDRIVALSLGRVGGQFRREEATQEAILAACMAGQ